jgi:hypothetical protein
MRVRPRPFGPSDGPSLRRLRGQFVNPLKFLPNSVNVRVYIYGEDKMYRRFMAPFYVVLISIVVIAVPLLAGS